MCSVAVPCSYYAHTMHLLCTSTYLHLHVLLGLIDPLLELRRLGGVLLLLDGLELELR